MSEKPTAELSADRPSTDPAHDLFGHAPFAKTLAKAIHSYRSSDGIVLALYGPWGSGKSTVLAYVEHELEQGAEAERPVVVTFNPWWFSGQENLAKAFLGQLQAVLPAKFKGFEKVGNLIAEFSGALGGVADLAAKSHGIPFLGKVVETGAKRLATKPKDVPALKKALSSVLLEQKKRVLVVIDDIDRLAPDEVRQLFTVIKALADFPYVTYLLAFDREVAATAINEQTGLPGYRYLEKIIQVPFELPKVDQSTLLQALFVRLDAVMATTPEGRFDPHYWANVFYSGLHRLFMVPRDIVRLTNALRVTYPAVVGEVNPVDFIAIECLRVFLPSVYDAIRTSPEQFCGYKAIVDRGDKERAKAFHDAWLQRVPEDLRDSTQELVQRLFPRLESVWSNMHYSGDSLQRWRAKLQVCVPEIFPAYFRLSLPAGTVTRADVDALLGATQDPAAFANLLREALAQKTARGTSKARALLERLMDHVDDFGPADAGPVITALLDMGDELLVRTDKVAGEFDFGNESRVSRVAYHLLKKVDAADRCKVVELAISTGRALRCGQYLIGVLAAEVDKEAKGEGRQALVRVDDVNGMKSAWLSRIEALACEPSFIDHPSLARLLDVWHHWGDESKVKAWWAQASGMDEVLPKLIAAFQSESTSHGFGDHAVRVHLRVNPKGIEPYDDVYALAARARALVESGQVPEAHAAAVKRFIIECERMKAGKSPDDFDFDDD
ncbi:KAP family P-loop NTPase fold protein [Herbaspirillum huttiense]|uniref:KAP family P-loop NTPase fold protein n=1 Tax=Herbaspirillum huttiense TaxID=863372 RepID=UPI002176B363|nr:P-loop NTPase fold protein [Herbaspirillum huttiense]UWE16599.1 P-loop NTPase fold protein [Herbaspirillum huttiense]